MQDWARGRAGGWAQHRSEAWFPSPDAMRCSFLGDGLGDRAAILGYLNPCALKIMGGSVAEWLACLTQAQKGPGSNRSRDAVG